MTRLLPLILILLALGCQGRASATFTGEREITVDEAGNVTIRHVAEARGKTTSPRGASEPTPLSADFNGVRSAVSGVWKALPSTIGQKWGWILMLGGIGMMGAGGFLFGTKWGKSAWILGITGAAMLALALASQATINALVIGLVVAAVAFGAWRFISRLRRQNALEAANRRERGIAAQQKLNAEGKYEEGIAARRGADPEWDWRGDAARLTPSKA